MLKGPKPGRRPRRSIPGRAAAPPRSSAWLLSFFIFLPPDRILQDLRTDLLEDLVRRGSCVCSVPPGGQIRAVRLHSAPSSEVIKRPGVGARLGLAPSTCDPHFFIRVGLGLTLPLPFFLKKSFAPRSRAKPASFLHRELSEGDEPRGYNITSSRGELFALAIKNAKIATCCAWRLCALANSFRRISKG